MHTPTECSVPLVQQGGPCQKGCGNARHARTTTLRRRRRAVFLHLFDLLKLTHQHSSGEPQTTARGRRRRNTRSRSRSRTKKKLILRRTNLARIDDAFVAGARPARPRPLLPAGRRRGRAPAEGVLVLLDHLQARAHLGGRGGGGEGGEEH